MANADQNTRYRVIGPDHEDVVRGFTLDDAFALMMKKAGTEFAFSRFGKKLRLNMMRVGGVPDMAFLNFDNADDREMLRNMFPLIESENLDDGEARCEIMRKAVNLGRDNYRCAIDLSPVTS